MIISSNVYDGNISVWFENYLKAIVSLVTVKNADVEITLKENYIRAVLELTHIALLCVN